VSGEFGRALERKVTAKMPQDVLEAHLTEVLTRVTMCALATSRGDVPRSTPLEFFSEGLTLYLSPDPGTKIKNLRSNPNLSISICNNPNPNWETDWQTTWGIQFTGRGELMKDGHPEYDHGREVIKFEEFLRALGREEVGLSRKRYILKVVPTKIELIDFGLVNRDYAVRQVWRAR
jgi:hypothetical protein